MDFKITDYGARSCDVLQTKKIQDAIDACFLSGGGRVIIPKGIFLTGGVRLRSNTTLYLESGAILRGSRDNNDYAYYLNDKIEPISPAEIEAYKEKRGSVNPYSKWNNGLIKILNAENVSIIGEPGSFIDGVDCYDENGEGSCRGPHAINAHNCINLCFDGYSIMNSANWAHNIMMSKNIVAKNVTVYGGHDGFDVRSCDDVTIEDCVFRTGDDCVAGFDNKNVVIRNCVFDCACSAMRFGGTDVLIENCRSIAPSSFGFRGSLTQEEKAASAPTNERTRHAMHTPFQYYCDFRADIRYDPGNIVVKNCKFENPNALFLHPYDGEHIWCCNRALNSFIFENCEITGLSLPGVLCADPDEPLDFRMKNVIISARKEDADFPIFEASGCKYIEFDNVIVKGFKSPHIISDNKDNIKFVNSTNVRVESR